MSTIIAAVIGPTITVGLAAFLQIRLRQQDAKVQEVHLLVNSQLMDALRQIDLLKAEVTALRDQDKDSGTGGAPLA